MCVEQTQFLLFLAVQIECLLFQHVYFPGFYKGSIACAVCGRRLVCQFAIVPWSRIRSVLK